jgi:hypothetical protein
MMRFLLLQVAQKCSAESFFCLYPVSDLDRKFGAAATKEERKAVLLQTP